jgi:hypothetical protein
MENCGNLAKERFNIAPAQSCLKDRGFLKVPLINKELYLLAETGQGWQEKKLGFPYTIAESNPQFFPQKPLRLRGDFPSL